MRRYKRIAVLGFFALCIRLLYAWWLGNSLFDGDAQEYIQSAHQFLQTGLVDPYWPPALPYLLAASFHIFGPGNGVATGTMLGVFIVFWFLLGHILSIYAKPKYVYLILGMFALSPAFIHHSVAPLTHLPLSVCLLAIYYLVISVPISWPSVLLIGLLLFIGTLLRPATILLLPLLITYFLFVRSSAFQVHSFSRSNKYILSLLIGTILPLSLFLHQSYQTYGYFFFVNQANIYNVYLGNNLYTPVYKTWWLGSHKDEWEEVAFPFAQIQDSVESLPPEKQAIFYRASVKEHIQTYPILFIRRTWNRIKVFWAFDTFTGARLVDSFPSLGWTLILVDGILYTSWMVLAIYGIWVSVCQAKEETLALSHLFLVGLIVLAVSIPYYFSFSHPTYHFPTLPLMSIVAISHLPLSWKAFFSSAWKRKILLFLSLLLFFCIQLEWILRMLNIF